MLAALEPFDPPWRTAPESLLARVGRSADEDRAVAADIINALDACEAPRGMIAFDDLHRVADAHFFRFLDLLVERMSPRWTLALSSRTEPPLSLARLRAGDELAEFRQLELQFARDDACRMATEAGVDPALADRLFDRTQGWPAGLRIAIGAARADPGGAASPAAVERALRAGNRPLFDFLLTEVLGDLPHGLVDFLERASVLTELEAKRCATVTGDTGAAAQLDAIERLGLFVEALDAPVRTLRLHDLLRDALQQRLTHERQDLLRDLRARAADTETDPVRRIYLRLDAEDYAQAAREVYEHVPPIVATSGTSTARNLIERFPAEFRDRSPELALVQGLVAWVHWDFKAMLAAFERAERGFLASGDEARALYARAYRATALMAHGRLDEAEAALASMRAAALTRETRVVLLNAESGWRSTQAACVPSPRSSTRWSTCWPPSIGSSSGITRRPPTACPACPESASRSAAACAGAPARGRRRFVVDSRDRNRLAGVVRAVPGPRSGSVAAAQSRSRGRELDRPHRRGHRAHARVVGVPRRRPRRRRRRGGTPASALRLLGPGYGAWGRYLMLLSCCASRRSARTRRRCAKPSRRCDEVGQRGGPPRAADAAAAGGGARLARGAHRRRDGRLARCVAPRGSDRPRTGRRARRACASRGRSRAAASSARPRGSLAPVFERAAAEDGPGGALFARRRARRAGRDRLGRGARRANGLRCCARGRRRSRPGARCCGPVTWARRTHCRRASSTCCARIAAGDSNKLIARAFDLSPHTVKRHVANILDKLGVETRGQAAAWFRSRAA